MSSMYSTRIQPSLWWQSGRCRGHRWQPASMPRAERRQRLARWWLPQRVSVPLARLRAALATLCSGAVLLAESRRDAGSSELALSGDVWCSLSLLLWCLSCLSVSVSGLLAVRQCATGPVEYLDENTQSVPVVGRNIVAGSGSALLFLVRAGCSILRPCFFWSEGGLCGAC